jgi:hypothetical protein
MRIWVGLAASLGLAAVAADVGQAQEHRELGPHVHGRGTLNIALEGSHLSMEFEAPGADIVGFEHPASTPEQTAAVEKAKKQLAAPQGLFLLPDSAGCALTDAKVTIDSEHHGDEHDHDADDHDHDHGSADPDHAGHQHSAFHAEYAFDCKAPARLVTMGFDYFKRYAGAQRLDVTVITPKGQSSFEVTRDKPRLDLGGII